MAITDQFEPADPQRLKLIYSRTGEMVGIQHPRGGINFRQRVTPTGDIELDDGSLLATSGLVAELAPTASSTTTFSSRLSYYWYRCTVAAGNITVYDNSAASGKILVPTTALALGTFPIGGAGSPLAVLLATGSITVVLSGAATVFVGSDPA